MVQRHFLPYFEGVNSVYFSYKNPWENLVGDIYLQNLVEPN